MKKYATVLPFDAIFADNKNKDKQDKNKAGREEPCGSELLQREKREQIKIQLNRLGE
jgi:hypothetical protein